MWFNFMCYLYLRFNDPNDMEDDDVIYDLIWKMGAREGNRNRNTSRIIRTMGGYLLGIIRHFFVEFPVCIWSKPLSC